MRIAYFSPLPPQRSGIADYSAELLPHLAAHADVDVWFEGYEPAADALPPLRRVDCSGRKDLLPQLADYDGIVYHLGNDVRYHESIYRVFLQHPGVVVLHDYSLHNFFAGYLLDVLKSPEAYGDEMQYNYGLHGRLVAADVLAGRRAAPWEVEPLRYPLIRRILDRATGLIVHSEFVKTLVHRTHPALPVRTIPHLARVLDDLPDPDRVKAGRGLPADKLLLASFGYVTATRRIDAIVRALTRLGRGDVLYLIVGEPAPDVVEQVRASGLGDAVRMTGHVDPAGFSEYLRIIDVCVSLRHPTMGETSGVVCRALGAGKPCIVSNAGWFAELPDDCVAKVDLDETEDELLLAYLRALLDDESLRSRMGRNARRYIRERSSPERAAREYIEFVASLRPSTRPALGDGGLIEDISLGMADLGISEHDDWLIEAMSREIVPLLSSGASSPAPPWRRWLFGRPGTH